MPIRPATYSDIPIMARVLAASMGPDELFQILFPHQDQYPEDLITAFRRKLRVCWWDYSVVMMVSYEQKPISTLNDLDHVERALTVRRGGKVETITGMCEWKREGDGWLSVWNLWRWDPRRLIKKLYEWRNRLAYFLRPCRASAGPTTEDPNPLQHDTWVARTLPHCLHLYSNPDKPWRNNHWSLELLATHPRHQSRGYGRELVQYGLAKAKCDTASGRTGIPCVVTSSLAGERFYQRNGFDELVGYASRSVDWVEGVNPLEERGCEGGAVIWTWVDEDKEARRNKIRDGLGSESTIDK